jgi:hypothetical protein
LNIKNYLSRQVGWLNKSIECNNVKCMKNMDSLGNLCHHNIMLGNAIYLSHISKMKDMMMCKVQTIPNPFVAIFVMQGTWICAKHSKSFVTLEMIIAFQLDLVAIANYNFAYKPLNKMINHTQPHFIHPFHKYSTWLLLDSSNNKSST